MEFACSWDQIQRRTQSTRLHEGEIGKMEEKPHIVWKGNIVGNRRTYKIFRATIRMSPPSQGNESLRLLLLSFTCAYFQPTQGCSSWNNNMFSLKFHVEVRLSLLQECLSQTIRVIGLKSIKSPLSYLTWKKTTCSLFLSWSLKTGQKMTT